MNKQKHLTAIGMTVEWNVKILNSIKSMARVAEEAKPLFGVNFIRVCVWPKQKNTLVVVKCSRVTECRSECRRCQCCRSSARLCLRVIDSRDVRHHYTKLSRLKPRSAALSVICLRSTEPNRGQHSPPLWQSDRSNRSNGSKRSLPFHFTSATLTHP